ncbi:hypothetical protein MNBD_ALPHA05-527 [hydrothermal vent metagenome]|uniref:DUF4350 domain-containing protein n=1 Tax=hydrothermal vent metagenome TaxID=652676 RepID=A0A3B0S707_9ZZZZ
MSAGEKTEPSSAFSRLTVIAIISVGIFTFSAFIVLSAYAPVLRDGNDGRGHALSKSAIGYAFLVALLEETGVPVLVARGAEPQARDGVLVYTPRDIKAMEQLGSLDEYQITVIVLPKWKATPDPMKPKWVRRAGMTLLTPLTLTLGERDVTLEFRRRKDAPQIIIEAADASGSLITQGAASQNIGVIENLQYFTPDDTLEPILKTKNGEILFAKVKDLPLYIISDTDLANTHGLYNVDRAKLTAAFFDYARVGGPVVFDLSLHGIARTRNIVRLALEPPFLAATLSALLGALLLGLKGAARFGPIRTQAPPFDAGKAALADNSAALIHMAKREEAFGARYADMTRRGIAKAIGAPKNLSPTELDALIDKISVGKPDVHFSILAHQVGAAGGVAPFVRAARRLYQFKKEIMRDHR